MEKGVRESLAPFSMFRGHKRPDVVQGATRWFEEPGALPQAARLARDGFIEHLTLLLAP